MINNLTLIVLYTVSSEQSPFSISSCESEQKEFDTEQEEFDTEQEEFDSQAGPCKVT